MELRVTKEEGHLKHLRFAVGISKRLCPWNEGKPRVKHPSKGIKLRMRFFSIPDSVKIGYPNPVFQKKKSTIRGFHNVFKYTVWCSIPNITRVRGWDQMPKTREGQENVWPTGVSNTEVLRYGHDEYVREKRWQVKNLTREQRSVEKESKNQIKIVNLKDTVTRTDCPRWGRVRRLTHPLPTKQP